MGHESSIAIKDLESVLRLHSNKSAVDQALIDYQAWASNITAPKPIATRLLYLLRCAEQRSGNLKLKDHKGVSTLIVYYFNALACNITQRIKKERLSLIWYGIGKRYQLELELRDLNDSEIKISIPDLI